MGSTGCATGHGPSCPTSMQSAIGSINCRMLLLRRLLPTISHLRNLSPGTTAPNVVRTRVASLGPRSHCRTNTGRALWRKALLVAVVVVVVAATIGRRHLLCRLALHTNDKTSRVFLNSCPCRCVWPYWPSLIYAWRCNTVPAFWNATVRARLLSRLRRHGDPTPCRSSRRRRSTMNRLRSVMTMKKSTVANDNSNGPRQTAARKVTASNRSRLSGDLFRNANSSHRWQDTAATLTAMNKPPMRWRHETLQDRQWDEPFGVCAAMCFISDADPHASLGSTGLCSFWHQNGTNGQTPHQTF